MKLNIAKKSFHPCFRNSFSLFLPTSFTCTVCANYFSNLSKFHTCVIDLSSIFEKKGLWEIILNTVLNNFSMMQKMQNFSMIFVKDLKIKHHCIIGKDH